MKEKFLLMVLCVCGCFGVANAQYTDGVASGQRITQLMTDMETYGQRAIEATEKMQIAQEHIDMIKNAAEKAKQISNYVKKFAQLGRLVEEMKLSKVCLFGTLIACVVICGLCIFKSYEFADEQRQKIYVLDNGKSLILALQQDVQMNRESEIKSHVRRFHELFFTLTPNQDAIDYNINQALFLADNSVLKFYKNNQEKGFYKSLIAANVIGDIQIDSVVVNANVYPYTAKCYAKTSYMRSRDISFSQLVTTQTLVNVQRYDNNPHGLLIENWEVEVNEQLGTKRR